MHSGLRQIQKVATETKIKIIVAPLRLTFIIMRKLVGSSLHLQTEWRKGTTKTYILGKLPVICHLRAGIQKQRSEMHSHPQFHRIGAKCSKGPTLYLKPH